MGAKIQERDLLKALNELEDLVEKGDALENQDTEGGFSTEGTPLSRKAPSGRSDVAKMLSASDIGDDASADYRSAMRSAKKKTHKSQTTDDEYEDDEEVVKADDGSDEDEGDDESKDDESEDEGEDGEDDESGPPMGKSFREGAEENETMRKAIEVSDFIEAMVDQTSSSLTEVQQAVRGVAALLTDRIEKSEAHQQSFNSRLAKAVVSIGNAVNDLSETLAKISGQPNVPQRRAVLSKSEVVEPHLGGQPGGGELGNVSREQVQDWLIQKSIAGQIDPVMVTVFEQNGYNPEVLPAHVRKALVNDLHK